MTKWKKGDFLGTTIKVNDIIARSDEVATSYLLETNQAFGIFAHRIVKGSPSTRFACSGT